MVALIPQPNILYRLYNFPIGKDFLDILLLAVLVGIFINKRGFERSGHTILIVILLLMSYLGIWNSTMNFSLPSPFTMANPILKPWKGYASMVLLYLLSFNAVKDDENQRKMMVLVMALVVLFVSFRSYRSFTAGGSFVEDSRSAGPFWAIGLGSNHFGAFIAHYATVFLGLLLMDDNRWRKILFLVTVLLSLHPLFFSYSRGAYAAAFVILLLFGLIKKRSLLILVFAIVIAWQTLLPSSVVDRISMTRSEDGSIEHSGAVRLELWKRAIDLFEKNPIIGSGLAAYYFTMPEGHWRDAHNVYLKTLCEQGIIGFALLVVVFYAAFKSGWKLYRSNMKRFERGLGLGFMGCVVACIITNLFGDRWSFFELGGYFWIFWGLVDRYIIISKSVIDENELQEENGDFRAQRE
jgi:O-antigen ligase